jgi:hypothetical protein
MGPAPRAQVEVTKLETDVTDASTGGMKVMLSEVEVVAEGEGQSEKLCADDFAAEMGGSSMSPEMQQALTNLASGLMKNTGVVATEFDGKWYVSPLRTYTELGLSAMSDLTPEDVIALITQS